MIPEGEKMTTETGMKDCCSVRHAIQDPDNLFRIPDNAPPRIPEAPWIDGWLETPAGRVPKIKAALGRADRFGGWKVRWSIGRMDYTVTPGLYAVGSPGAASPIFVSANYKLSFDRLREQLEGIDSWLLVLDTRGINVWCAAGKGTFGTAEIVRRVRESRLDQVVSHRKLVVPQLGAPGVSAHEVKRETGFRVIYGPVLSRDLPAFMEAGMKATPEMRRVRFPFLDRVALIPVELVGGIKYALMIAAAFFLLSGLGSDGYSLARAASQGAVYAGILAAAFLLAASLTPALLPWLPGRAFAVKSAWIGLAMTAGMLAVALGKPELFGNLAGAAAMALIIPAIASFTGMNFTGASTYTSLSGVVREMRVAVPVQAVFAGGGLILWLAARFL